MTTSPAAAKGRTRMRVLEPSGPDPVWWSGGLDADRPRPLLVLLTGALGGGRECGRLLRHLVRRGHAVVAARVPEDASSASALTRLIDRYADRSETARTAVVGFDLSGRTALETAAVDGRVRAVHLVSTPAAGLTLSAEELFDIDAAVRVGYALGDPLTLPQDLALLRLTVRDVGFRAFPTPYRSAPGGRAVRRWLARDVTCPRPAAR